MRNKSDKSIFSSSRSQNNIVECDVVFCLFGFQCFTHGSPNCPPRLLPTRECYGHALFLAKRFQEAEKIFRQALVKDSFHAEPKLEMFAGKGCSGLLQEGCVYGFLLCMFLSCCLHDV